MNKVQLGNSDLHVTPICLGTMTFGEQVNQADAHTILDRALEPSEGRIAKFESIRKQRWGRPEALVAARRYNALAQANGLSPTRIAQAFCYTKWHLASTIIGVTSMAQLDEDIDAFGTTLSAEVLSEIDKIRWEMRDPAL